MKRVADEGKQGKMGFQESIDWQIFDSEGKRKYVSQAERIRFLEAADREPKLIKALCYLLTYTGCRISEALSLKRLHIDAERHVVTFQTLKRRKLHFRSVPVPRFVTAMLLDLGIAIDDVIWAVHRSTAWRWIKRIMQYAQIHGPQSTCKGLRHGFGIRAATQSVPPNLIQRWMGHASPHTTAIYLDVVGNEERLFARRMWNENTGTHDLRLAA